MKLYRFSVILLLVLICGCVSRSLYKRARKPVELPPVPDVLKAVSVGPPRAPLVEVWPRPFWLTWDRPVAEHPLIRYEVRYATNLARFNDPERLPVLTNTHLGKIQIYGDLPQAFFIVRRIDYVYLIGTTNIDFENPVSISDWNQ